MKKYILAKSQLKSRLEQLRMNLARSGMNPEMIEKRIEEELKDPKYKMGFQNDLPTLTLKEQRELEELDTQELKIRALINENNQEIAYLLAKNENLMELLQKNHDRVCGIQGHRFYEDVSLIDGQVDRVPGNLARGCRCCDNLIPWMKIGNKDCVVVNGGPGARRLKPPKIQS